MLKLLILLLLFYQTGLISSEVPEEVVSKIEDSVDLYCL